MRAFSTTFSASSRCMFRSSTLPPARAALTMMLTAGGSIAGSVDAAGVRQGQRAFRRRAGRAVYHSRMSELLHAAETIRIVLVGTQHPGNIGSAARAMKTMGLRRLALVAPER